VTAFKNAKADQLFGFDIQPAQNRQLQIVVAVVEGQFDFAKS